MIHRPRPVVLVCGGRDYDDRGRLYNVLDRLNYLYRGFLCVIHGAARGADTLAAEWAEASGIPTLPFPILPEDWEAHGRLAGPIRNAPMIREGKPDVVIAFPGGPGTRNMRRQAHAHGIVVLP